MEIEFFYRFILIPGMRADNLYGMIGIFRDLLNFTGYPYKLRHSVRIGSIVIPIPCKVFVDPL
ncbi:hypothetical protein WS58_13300 [Burkholderia pseudomultivorans]|nr:hypothetical protein WS57_28950 [Burkholderia pseudomultivorans]KVC45784.1 hypothetical protein WS58_13300 [Burkholderia pseudomultivorans]KVG63661.1 hypothetical protein WS80_20725 [Burkholderia pseudomultivorans]